MNTEEPIITEESAKEEPVLTEVHVVPETPVSESAESSVLPSIPQLCVALVILAAVLGSPYALSKLRPEVTPLADTVESAPEPRAVDPYADVSLEASAVYVWDVAAQKSLYARNAHAQLPLASLTKLMTALVAYESSGSDRRVAITAEAIAQEGEYGLRDGESWSTNELLDFTLVSSSNDGAYALAAAIGARQNASSPEASFIDMMNERARALGLGQTYFNNSTGLDASASQSGGYGSARDMAFLMEHMIEETPQLLAGTTEVMRITTDAQGTLHAATNTNEIISAVTNPLGSKTGYTELAGGNLVVAYDAGLNHPIIIAVLGSSREGRFRDVSTLIERTTRLFIEETP